MGNVTEGNRVRMHLMEASFVFSFVVAWNTVQLKLDSICGIFGEKGGLSKVAVALYFHKVDFPL